MRLTLPAPTHVTSSFTRHPQPDPQIRLVGEIWNIRSINPSNPLIYQIRILKSGDLLFQLLHLWEALHSTHALILQASDDGLGESGDGHRLVHEGHAQSVQEVEDRDHREHIKPEQITLEQVESVSSMKPTELVVRSLCNLL